MNPGRWLKQTVTYQTKGSIDVNGEYTLAAAETIPARVQASEHVIRSADDTERIATHVIYTETLIPMGAVVWVPGTDSAEIAEGREVLQTGGSPRLHDTSTNLYKASLG